MNVLFLTLLEFESLNESNIYTDLLRVFIKNMHTIYVISPTEKRNGIKTHLVHEERATILRLQIGNTQKTNIIEKGISTVIIEPKVKAAIKKYFAKIKFDLVLYSTPPISFVSAIEYVKKRDNAKSYLLLKDIFPQNAVDIGLMHTKGYKGFIYRHFRKQEKRLYHISDNIGCMSKANVNYIISHNGELDPRKVEVCPNSIEIVDKSIDYTTKQIIRDKYGIPRDKIVFIYGGNLGKPQGVPFVIRCLSICKHMDNAFFLIIGDGTDYSLLESYAKKTKQQNLKVIRRLPKAEYDLVVAACDVGLIFLDYRFTIPNFPSRLLGYMQAKLPVLACTDPNTDIGKVIVDGQFGWKCASNNPELFRLTIGDVCTANLDNMKENVWKCLNDLYSSEHGYRIIIDKIRGS